MKKLKIKFTDFWPGFDPYNNFILNKFSNKYDVEISDDPDYVIYSVFGWDFLNYYDCVRIFFSGENVRPDFNMCDYAIGFDYMEFPRVFQDIRESEIREFLRRVVQQNRCCLSVILPEDQEDKA